MDSANDVITRENTRKINIRIKPRSLSPNKIKTLVDGTLNIQATMAMDNQAENNTHLVTRYQQKIPRASRV